MNIIKILIIQLEEEIEVCSDVFDRICRQMLQLGLR